MDNLISSKGFLFFLWGLIMENILISLAITTFIFNMLYVIFPSMHGDTFDNSEEDDKENDFWDD